MGEEGKHSSEAQRNSILKNKKLRKILEKPKRKQTYQRIPTLKHEEQKRNKMGAVLFQHLSRFLLSPTSLLLGHDDGAGYVGPLLYLNNCDELCVICHTHKGIGNLSPELTRLRCVQFFLQRELVSSSRERRIDEEKEFESKGIDTNEGQRK